QEPKQQNQDHRGDVDPAEIRENTPNRPQQRLGDPPEKVPDRSYGAVVPVDDTESDQPAQDGLGNQQPDIDRNYRVDEAEQGIHMTGNPAGNAAVTVALPGGGRKLRRTGMAPPRAVGPRLTGAGTVTIVRGARRTWSRGAMGP